MPVVQDDICGGDTENIGKKPLLLSREDAKGVKTVCRKWLLNVQRGSGEEAQNVGEGLI